MSNYGAGSHLRLHKLMIITLVLVLNSNANGQTGDEGEKQPEVQPAIESMDDLLNGLDLKPPAPVTIPDATGEADPLEGPGGGPETRSPSSLFQAFQSMQTAGQMLSRGQVNEEVVEAQRRAVDLLDQLIDSQEQNQISEQNQRRAGEQANNKPERSPDMQQEDQSLSDSPAPTDTDPNSDATSENETPQPSDESPTAGNAGETPGSNGVGTKSPLNAAGQGVWGHLPQRTRGLLRAEMPTDYLPGYSTQISDYFKKLAEMPSDQ